MGSVSHPGPVRRRAARTAAVALSAVVLGSVLLVSQPAAAESASALQSKVDSARAKSEALESRIEAQSAELEASRADAVAAARREAELNATLAQGQQRAEQLQVEVDRSQEALRRARAKLKRSSRILSNRLVDIYKHGEPDELELLLNSGGYDDLATRAEYLQRIQDADAALVDRTRDLRAEVDARLARVSAARDQQLDHNAEVAAARDQIAAVRAQADARATALVEARNSQQAAIGELHDRVANWQKQVQKAEQISAAQAEQEVIGQMGDWAIPAYIVMCESGGNYQAVNPSSGAGGAYQILPSTWKLYGGKGLPQDASPAEQDRIAALIWADSGTSAWSCG
jgi:septal ring factor EnvC (AmiA/AmiB activator)